MIKGIQGAPTPTNKQQLQSFIGLMTYNDKFIPNLAHTLHPLYQLLRKNTKWVWQGKHEESKLPNDCCVKSVFSPFYDIHTLLKLYRDASSNGLDACLVHVVADKSKHPVAYTSRTQSTLDRNHVQVECEDFSNNFCSMYV